MNFSYPWVLVGLALPMALLAWVWLRRGRQVVVPFDHGLPGTGRGWRVALQLGETLPVLALAVGILLLAGPQHVAAPKAQRELTNIQFCLDVSGSMSADFGVGNRYDAAMKSINEFLDYREGDAFGLTFFGQRVLHWVPLTSDASAFRCATPFMGPQSRMPGFQGTAIGRALLASRQVLASRAEGDKMIILVSDGASADLEGNRVQEVIRKLRDDNIAVYGIHIADFDAPEPVVKITSATGGEIFTPSDPNSLEHVFRQIDQMQEAKIEKVAAERVDYFEPFCWVGLVLVGLYSLIQLGLRYTPW